jgi:formylglycine-generating enzyme required for sulfatase activity
MKKDEMAIYEGCQQLAAAMLGGRNAGNSPSPSGANSSGSGGNGSVYNPDGIELVYVEGTGNGILVTPGFYIGKYEVTQAQYQAIMGVNPSGFNGSNHPVETVSWNDVQEFITRLNARTGRNYRLPTEAEWEYAAREGKNNSNYMYSGSDSIGAVAWYDGNSGDTTHHPVGQKLPNALGIYDMSGNVYEWCQNCSDSSCSSRVRRGGSWNGDEWFCRISSRYLSSPSGDRYRNLGFRVACDLK